jgi:hypothetical protein
MNLIVLVEIAAATETQAEGTKRWATWRLT